MSRPRSINPKYRKNPRTGQAVIDVYLPDGRRTTRTLPGAFGSEESRQEYLRLCKMLVEGSKLPANAPARPPADLFVAELACRFLTEHLDVEVDKASSEYGVFRQVLKVLGRVAGRVEVRDFDAQGLKLVRKAMITGSWMNAKEIEAYAKRKQPIGWSRGNCNKCVSRIRSVFRWGLSEKLVPADIVLSLESLKPLAKGKGGARETKRVTAAPLEDVEKAIPKMPPHVAVMVRLQLVTAMRPGELCAMRGQDVDRTGPFWIYRPEDHKTKHLDHNRAICLGPRAQLLLRPFLGSDPAAHVFSPMAQRQLINAEKRKNRKTPVQPSQVDRSNPDAKKRPGLAFSVKGYGKAVNRACIAAGVTPWHPHMLRHLAAMLIRREHGAEACRAALGHRHVRMSDHYSGIDIELAGRVASAMG